MNRGKRTNGAPNGTTRLMCATVGSPSRRESDGDGVSIVVRARESRVQGEGEQGVQQMRGKVA